MPSLPGGSPRADGVLSPLQDRLDRHAEILTALTVLVAELPQLGFGLCFQYLWNAEHRWNRKRMLLVYRQRRLRLSRRVN